MEKRLFTFIVLSVLVWGSFIGMQMYFNPPKPKLPAADAAKAKELAKGENKPEQDKGKTSPEDPKTKPDPAATPVPTQTVPRQRITLGSLDPASGYTMLVTLDNRGAAIERIELSAKPGIKPSEIGKEQNQFHDLDDLSGYLGHLALSDGRSGGAVVNVVGPGTPAALATDSKGSVGLLPGDLIQSIDKIPVTDAEMLQRHLQKQTKPKQTIELDVERSPGQLSTFTVVLGQRPLELVRPENNSGATPVPGEPGAFGRVGPPSYRMTLRQIGGTSLGMREDEIDKLPSLFESNWEVENYDAKTGTITFAMKLQESDLAKIGGAGSLKVTKTFSLATKNDTNPLASYHVGLKIDVENTGDKPQAVAYRLEGPNGLPLEGWWYANKVHPGWSGAGARDVAYSAGKSHLLVGNPLLISHAVQQTKEGNPPNYDLFTGMPDVRSLEYLMVDTQYFACGLIPGDVLSDPTKLKSFTVDTALARPLNVITDKKWSKTTNVSFYFDSPVSTLEPQGHLSGGDFLIFAGPKDAGVLEAYHIARLNEYGWFPWVSKPLKAVLDTIYFVIPNYGIAIILLTVIVRLGMLPLSIRQAKSAAVMQQLAPELAKLKEKYAGDMEKQASAQRELFAKHGFNPMGGCLLMFFQLPIFIGLYRCLATDIDLREAALIPGIHWASNLAGPDQLFRWKEYVWPMIGDEAHGWLGPYFNVLPLITIALFMVQQKLFSPPAIDEEQKMQQKIMSFMTIFMGVMFYKVPAGLCIYFITSSLWGIAERKLLPKPKPGALPPAVTEKPEQPSKPSGEPGWLEKLFGMADAQLKESKGGGTLRNKEKGKK